MKQGAASETQSGMQQLAQASLLRLKNWDISNEQIAAMAKSGAAQRTLTLRSPDSGIVMEKKAVQGMRFMPGEMLLQTLKPGAKVAVEFVERQPGEWVITSAKPTDPHAGH